MFSNLEMEYPITAVSGYWNVKNKHQTAFTDSWLSKALRINCPYVLFCEEKEMLEKNREGLPTTFCERKMKDFHTYKFYDSIQTHPIHVPSKELQCIWNEKLFLLREVARTNPYNSEWFIWIDAGLFLYREKFPPSTPFCSEKLKTLPKDKFLFTSSCSPYFEPHNVQEGNYYHHVSGIFMLHKDFVETFVSMYETYTERFLSKKDWIYTDQVILTHMLKENPDMFLKVADDYGSLVLWLYDSIKC